MSSSRNTSFFKLAFKPTITTFISVLLTSTILVSAKHGHYSASVKDTSGPCIDRCSDIYTTGLAACAQKYPNALPGSHDRDYCVLDVANAFQLCSAACIPAAAKLPDTSQ